MIYGNGEVYVSDSLEEPDIDTSERTVQVEGFAGKLTLTREEVQDFVEQLPDGWLEE